MMTEQAIYLALLGGTGSLAAALLAVVALGFGRRRPGLIRNTDDRAVFVIENGRILDVSARGRTALDITDTDTWDAEALIRRLTDLFPQLPTTIPRLDSAPSRSLTAVDGVARLDLERDGERLRLTFTDDPTERVAMDRSVHSATAAELDALRAVSESLPHAVWQISPGGQITWVNRAYLDLLAEITDDHPSFPPQVIFDLDGVSAGETRRIALNGKWFDCHAVASGDGALMISALPADNIVKAEDSLDAFKQTMSRTFAHLTVGLAVFDRWRRLAVFNPALTDLTSLPIDILLSRPTLESFLDILRARQLMPEPRDYSSWREKVLDIEKTAQSGTYSELWHLGDGRTYRITGRPQPDGAFALLMEDISGEIGLTRRFRAEIETGRSVLDALPEAVAVFDEIGHLTMTNAAYDALWNIDTIDSVTQLGLRDAVSTWRSHCEPDADWDRIALDRNGSCDLRHSDGRRLRMTSKSIQGGARLICFRISEAEVSTLMPAQARKMISNRLKA